MRVLIATAGARGDVAPLTGLASAIRAAGHSVTIASNDEYEGLVVGCGLEFRALPGTHGMFNDLQWVERSGLAAGVGIIRLLAENVRRLHKAVLAVARQDAADVLALAGMTAIGGYQVAEGLGLPSLELQLMPTHATADFPPSIVTGRTFGRLGNRVAGMATTAAMAAMGGLAREIRHELGLPRRGIREVLSGEPATRRWPVFHGFSPAVVPRPADWPDGYEVTGYWWPQRAAAWSPPPELETFLASGPPPVFFGFGDVTPDDASGFIELAAGAGREAGARQVIQAGQTAQHSRSALPPGDSIVIGDVPHDWLFPRMAAVVHHAGAGTTAAGLRAGVPCVTVPVLADQPFWAARLAALGVGPAPIPRRHLSVAALATAVRDAVAPSSYRTQAQALSRQLAGEDGAAPIVSWLARRGGS